MSKVFILCYFYPGGIFAGVMGVYATESKATTVMQYSLATDYPDCTFTIIEGEVQ